jgi:hypothetical protein
MTSRSELSLLEDDDRRQLRVATRRKRREVIARTKKIWIRIERYESDEVVRVTKSDRDSSIHHRIHHHDELDTRRKKRRRNGNRSKGTLTRSKCSATENWTTKGIESGEVIGTSTTSEKKIVRAIQRTRGRWRLEYSGERAIESEGFEQCTFATSSFARWVSLAETERLRL